MKKVIFTQCRNVGKTGLYPVQEDLNSGLRTRGYKACRCNLRNQATYTYTDFGGLYIGTRTARAKIDMRPTYTYIDTQATYAHTYTSHTCTDTQASYTYTPHPHIPRQTLKPNTHAPKLKLTYTYTDTQTTYTTNTSQTSRHFHTNNRILRKHEESRMILYPIPADQLSRVPSKQARRETNKQGRKKTSKKEDKACRQE